MSWGIISVLALAVCAAELHAPLAIDLGGLAGLALASLVLAGAIFFYSRVREDQNLQTSCIAILQALLFSAAGSILSYLLARNGGPLWDATLYSWDQGIGLDWVAYVRFVDSHAWLALLFRLVYGSLIPQIIIVILALGFSGRLDELRTFILAAIGSGTVAILLSAAFPAVSNYVHLGLTGADFQHVNPWAGYVHLDDLMALRAGEMTALNLPRMQGIITFPSYHACLATLTLWGFWKSRLKSFRWAGAIIALSTIAATPVDGGHYFVDVIAGAAIATLSIMVAGRLIYMRTPLPSAAIFSPRRSRAALVQ